MTCNEETRRGGVAMNRGAQDIRASIAMHVRMNFVV